MPLAGIEGQGWVAEDATDYPVVECVECGRVFDLEDGNDCEEWTYGHDCEPPDPVGSPPPHPDDTRVTIAGLAGVAWWFDKPCTEHADCGLYVMVGDDRRWHIDYTDVTPIADDAYCSGCGQTGCGHGR